jgi:hypothetical protein
VAAEAFPVTSSKRSSCTSSRCTSSACTARAPNQPPRTQPSFARCDDARARTSPPAAVSSGAAAMLPATGGSSSHLGASGRAGVNDAGACFCLLDDADGVSAALRYSSSSSSSSSARPPRAADTGVRVGVAVTMESPPESLSELAEAGTGPTARALGCGGAAAAVPIGGWLPEAAAAAAAGSARARSASVGAGELFAGGSKLQQCEVARRVWRIRRP